MESELRSEVARAIEQGDEGAFAWINERVIGDGSSLSELLLTSDPSQVGLAIVSSMLSTLGETEIYEFLSRSNTKVRVFHHNSDCLPYEELVRIRVAARTQKFVFELSDSDFSDEDVHYFLRLEDEENARMLDQRMQNASKSDKRAYLFHVINLSAADEIVWRS